MKLFSQDDVDTSILAGARVAVLGYGSQGRAHALNLRDSRFDVVVGVRQNGPSAQKARADALEVASMADATRGAQVVAMLLPDTTQPEVFENDVAANLQPDAMLLFAHGFNIHYSTLKAPASVDVTMIAPKSPGALVRREFEKGQGVPCLLAVHQDHTGFAHARALAYAHGIGGTRAGVLETSFAEETETDLFGEQAVLCGGVTELVVAGFETLTQAGYQPEVAYFECLHELKLIVDLMYEGGLAKMHQYVSDTAKYGDLTRGHRIIDAGVRVRMREVLAEVRNGTFAREWIAENKRGCPEYKRLLAADLDHKIETVGRGLRERMSWLKDSRKMAGSSSEKQP